MDIDDLQALFENICRLYIIRDKGGGWVRTS